MVLADSHGIPRVPCYSGYDFSKKYAYNYWTFTIYGAGFSCFVLTLFLIFFVFPLPLFTGLGYSRFARRYYGNRFCFLLLQLLRCFNSLGCLFPTYEFIGSSRGCPIRESSDQSLLPAPRSVSPVSAPFIVSGCLGLRRKP